MYISEMSRKMCTKRHSCIRLVIILTDLAKLRKLLVSPVTTEELPKIKNKNPNNFMSEMNDISRRNINF